MKSDISRRNFLRTVAVAGVAGATVNAGWTPRLWAKITLTQLPGKKLKMAFIGTGGIGKTCIGEFVRIGVDCPCYCDVDKRHYEEAAKHWPNAKSFQDYREMFDRMHKEFDAVVICTPDHSHYPATLLAMRHEKSVYTQKPLTHTVWEARELTKLHKNYKFATQMGNQGNAMEGWRIVYEWVHQGAIGEVKEIHAWTNRPIWPQGIDRPVGSDPVPAGLDWDLWLGSAPQRPYKIYAGSSKKHSGVYHPFNWRGWYDFGCGALGDMACHVLNATFQVMQPGYPSSVEVVSQSKVYPETYSKASTVKWSFPANDKRPAFQVYWYDGKRQPPRPPELEKDRRLNPEGGCTFVGTKGTILVSGSYSESPRIIPEAKLRQIGKPNRMLERSPGHYKEFVMSALGEKPLDYCKSNFGYSAPMTETILLGCIAQRLGKRLEWDGLNMKITNNPQANRLLTKEYRPEFKF